MNWIHSLLQVYDVKYWFMNLYKLKYSFHLICIAQSSECPVYANAEFAVFGNWPCWKNIFQLIMTGQRKPPTSSSTWQWLVWLGQCPVTDGWLGQRLTSVSSFSSTSLAFSVWILSEPATAPLPPSFWSSNTVATIGSICQPHGEVSLSASSACSSQVHRCSSFSSSHLSFHCLSPFLAF